MQTSKLFLLCALLAVGLSGCAWVRQTVTLRPEPKIESSNVGRDVTIAVRVVDRRPSNVIGYRGVDSKNARITSEQDVTGVFRQKIMEGLARKGFATEVYEGQPGRLLTVEVRRIDYSTDMEFWKGVIHVQSELVASMVKDGVKFEQAYFAERKETTVEAPRAKTNARLINGVISDSLQRLFEDERLIRYLAE